ncbi:MAG: ABC transporter permease [Clostridia bacterium]|nr:ABC transporter permease [Clostridia bacterium]
MSTVAIALLLMAALRISTPYILASMGGLFSEISGVQNIALEGYMLVGAFSAVVGSYFTGNPWVGLLLAGIGGMLFSAIHAVVCIYMKGNQIVSGIALNILGAAITYVLLSIIFEGFGTSPKVTKLPQWTIPGTEISFNPLVYMLPIVVVLTWLILYKTPLGIKMRSVGEYPRAADTVGINVYRTRFIAVLITGFLTGLAGAHLSIGEGSAFVAYMANGRGYIAIAAIIFGNWKPSGALIGSLIFGLAEAVQITLSGAKIGEFKIPNDFVQMIPYIITILVLVLYKGRSRGPAASGVAYEK